MKWFRTLLIISSIGVLCASSISDDGALGHKRGGGSGDDKGKQSGGDSGKSSGGRSEDNRNKDDNKNNNNSGGSSGGGHTRDKDNNGGGNSGGSSGNNSGGNSRDKDRDRDNGNSNSGGGSNSGGISSGGGSRNDSDRGRGNDNSNNNERQGHSRGDRGNSNGSGDSRSNGNGNSNGSGSSNSGRDNDRIGGSDSGRSNGTIRDRDLNRDRGNNRGDDRIIIGGSSSGGSSSGRTGGSNGGRYEDNLNRGGGTITSGGSRTSGSDPFAKRKPGSSTSTVYGSTNNHRNDTTWTSRPPERDRPPLDVFNPSLKNLVRREDNVRAHHRSGYYHYDIGWRDDDFFFGYYYFNPVYDRCVVSPFYWYPHVPGYLNRNRVLVMRVGTVSIYWDDTPNYIWDSCPNYNYRRSYWYESRSNRAELDYALDDLVDAWEDSNKRCLNRLIPDRGNIGIYIDERYDYSMNADDFYDLMLDNIQSARTKNYEILSVKKYRNEARVVALHEYVDPWDRRDRVYHVYRLVDDGYGYTIADFGTSDRRPKR